MCVETLAAALIGLGGSLGSALLAPSAAEPPPLPAKAPDQTKAPGATVRVGNGQEDETTDSGPVQLNRTTDTRVFGRPVGGLGMSGLSI